MNNKKFTYQKKQVRIEIDQSLKILVVLDRFLKFQKNLKAQKSLLVQMV